jgi:hypothetical protein
MQEHRRQDQVNKTSHLVANISSSSNIFYGATLQKPICRDCGLLSPLLRREANENKLVWVLERFEG